jgi:hypothetical protein
MTTKRYGRELTLEEAREIAARWGQHGRSPTGHRSRGPARSVYTYVIDVAM